MELQNEHYHCIAYQFVEYTPVYSLVLTVLIKKTNAALYKWWTDIVNTHSIIYPTG